jgi:hypothetical protein
MHMGVSTKHKPPPTALRVVLVGVASLVALIVGLVLHGHYQPIAQVCNSGVGALGQAISSSAQESCSTDSSLAGAGHWATIIGGFVLAIRCAARALRAEGSRVRRRGGR